MSTGDEIKKLRLERKLSQAALAEMTDLTQRTISQIEKAAARSLMQRR